MISMRTLRIIASFMLPIVAIGGFGLQYFARAQIDPSQITPEYIDALIKQYQTGIASSSALDAGLAISPNPAKTGEAVIARSVVTGASSASSYTWFVNGSVRSDLSGVGKNIAAFLAPLTTGTLNVRVEVRGGGLAATTTQIVSLPLVQSATQELFQTLQKQADDLEIRRQETESAIAIFLESSPSRPAPGEKIVLLVNSYQVDLSLADIRWSANGKSIGGGKGIRSVPLLVGSAGTQTAVRVAVTMPDGRTAEQTLDLTPASISFYWWTDGYVPVWYRGKSVPVPGGTIFIQARPSFSESLASQMEYSWTVSGEPTAATVGENKSILIYTIPSDGRIDDIRVRVQNQSRSIAQEASFSPPILQPRMELYEIIPFRGQNTARTATFLERPAGNTIDIIAEPFYFPRRLLAALGYHWNLNGQELYDEKDPRPYMFTLTSTAETAGLQRLSVTTSSADPQAARASAEINIDLR